MAPKKEAAAKRVATSTSGTEGSLAKRQKVLLLRPKPLEGTETVERIETYVPELVPYVEETLTLELRKAGRLGPTTQLHEVALLNIEGHKGGVDDHSGVVAH